MPGLLGALSLLLLQTLLDPLLLWWTLLHPLRLWWLLLRLMNLLLLPLLLSRLFGPLLWWLGGLSVPLLALVLMSAGLRLLRLLLRARLLRGRRRFLLLPTLLLFRLTLSLVLLVVLRERRGHRPEKQKQGSGAGNSNDVHSNRLP